MVQNLAIDQTGFTIASASVNLPGTLALGSLLKLTAPTVTLTNVAYTLPVGGTTTSTSGGITAPGSVVVTPAVMEPYIVVGANLQIDEGQNDQEIVTVSAVTPTTFTATLAQMHSADFTIADADTRDTLSGTVGFSAGSASLQFGSDLDASVAQSNGTYNLATEALSLTLATFNLSLLNFANITASTVALSYTPATDGSSEFLVGATGVGVLMGTGTSPNQVGVDVSNGTLAVAVFDSTAGAITYALDITGTAAILGLPANSISVTPGNIEFRDNNAGALSTTVPDGTTSIPLSFTGNETDVLAGGLGISVGSFASITGDFGFSEFTAPNGDTDLAIGAENVTAAVSAGDVSLTVTGASLGLLIDTTSTPATYALVANGGTDSLSGVPGLTLTGTGLAVRVRSGLDPSTLSSELTSGVITPDGTVSLAFSTLGTGTSYLTDVEGTVTLAVANFVSISGSFGFDQFSDDGATYLAVGGYGVSVMLGNSNTNLMLTDINLGLVIEHGPSFTQTDTSNGTTSSISLQNPAIPAKVVVTATPSGGMPVKLIAGIDYTLSTDTSGNTTVNFINIPASGTTINTTYTGPTTYAARCNRSERELERRA